MIRNLKTLGLIVMAIFALAATTAPGAVAGVFTSSTGQNFTATGTEKFISGNAFTGAFGVFVKCPGTTYTGHKWAATPKFALASGETRMTLTPSYVNCQDQNGAARTVDMNGCDYLLANATQAFAQGTYAPETDVICSGENKIEITGGICKIEIGSQSGLAGLHLTNESGHVRLARNVNLAAKVCGFSTTATQHLDVTFSAHNELGESVGISMST